MFQKDQAAKKAAAPAKEEDKEEVEEVGSENETDEDEEDDYIDILPAKIDNKYKKGPRSSVSAEAFGVWNKKSDFKPTIVEKSGEAKLRILTRLDQAFMFSALDEKEKSVVVDAMTERKAQPGEFIIQEGEDGDNLYVVEQGELDCTKVFKGNTDPTYLKTFVPGEAFGELALLYNAPRAATIKAKTESILWALDRNTFNHVVKDAAAKKREKYE